MEDDGRGYDQALLERGGALLLERLLTKPVTEFCGAEIFIYYNIVPNAVECESSPKGAGQEGSIESM